MDKERISEKLQVEEEIRRLESRTGELKILYEQYFLDIEGRPPLELEREIERRLRVLAQSPFKNAATTFRIKTLQQRLNTYRAHWRRVMREREDGSYSRDVFKRRLRENPEQQRHGAQENAAAEELGFKSLFETYRGALEREGLDSERISYEDFKRSLVRTARELKGRRGVRKISYKVYVADGRVGVRAVARKE